MVEAQNPPIKVFELRKIRRLTDFEVDLKL